MKGRYIYPHCGSMGLGVTCYLSNTARNSAKNIEANIIADIRVYKSGELVFEKNDFAVLAPGSFAPVKISEMDFSFDPNADYAIAIDCIKGERKDFTYFAQEHQVVFETENGQRASLLYDHQPAFPRNGKYSQILVLAPKILLSEQLNTHVIFTNTREELDKRVQDEPLEITIFDQSGKVVIQHKEKIGLNDVYIFDVKKHMQGRNFGKQPEFFNLTAKSGEAVYSIFTIIRNEVTRNIAIEHSLPPHYYVSGDKNRIRDEALKFA